MWMVLVSDCQQQSNIKELSHCHKLWFFKTMNSFRSINQRLTTSGYKDIVIKKLEFGEKTPFLCFKESVSKKWMWEYAVSVSAIFLRTLPIKNSKLETFQKII